MIVKLFERRVEDDGSVKDYLEMGNSLGTHPAGNCRWRKTLDATLGCKASVTGKVTFAMMTIKVCSLMLKGPGLRCILRLPSTRGSLKDQSGIAHAMNLPTGYASNLTNV